MESICYTFDVIRFFNLLTIERNNLILLYNIKMIS